MIKTLLAFPFNGLSLFFDRFRRLWDLKSVISIVCRFYLFKVFFVSGLTKINNWQSTVFLFENEYDVPLLPAEFAAKLGTGAELALPVLLLFGLGARLPALFLFIFNVVAVIAYRTYLFGDGWPVGFIDHCIWGLLMLIIMVYSHGKLSFDHVLQKLCPKYIY